MQNNIGYPEELCFQYKDQFLRKRRTVQISPLPGGGALFNNAYKGQIIIIVRNPTKHIVKWPQRFSFYSPVFWLITLFNKPAERLFFVQ